MPRSVLLTGAALCLFGGAALLSSCSDNRNAPVAAGGAGGGGSVAGSASGGGAGDSAVGAGGAAGGSAPDGGGAIAVGGFGGVETGGAGGVTGRVRRTADEVVVVYNENSPISVAVAQDYMQKRHVENAVTIRVPDSAVSTDDETIALADYESAIEAPVKAFLDAHAGVDFVVLTKGVPIRVTGAKTGCCQDDGMGHPNGKGEPSVDSSLAAMDYASLGDAKLLGITGSGTVGMGYLNRYWNATVPFSHDQFGGYIVTRLDGYTEADVKALTAHALQAEQSLSNGRILLDLAADFGLGDKYVEPAPVTKTVTAESDWSTWNADMLRAHDFLEAAGVANQTDISTTFQSGMGLLGYFSWGSNDSHFNGGAYAGLTFAPGAISDTAVSTSARTFLPTQGGQSLLVDLIAHGLTFGKGYVGEPLLQGTASPYIALSRYVGGFSAAESLAAASRFTGWEDIIIGDPLGAPYAAAPRAPTPIAVAKSDASSDGLQVEDCDEGGTDVAKVKDGSFARFDGVGLSGATTFVARVASDGAGGKLEVHVGDAAGALIASCDVPKTGGWQAWKTIQCPLQAPANMADLYLAFTGSGDSLFSVEWFALR